MGVYKSISREQNNGDDLTEFRHPLNGPVEPNSKHKDKFKQVDSEFFSANQRQVLLKNSQYTEKEAASFQRQLIGSCSARFSPIACLRLSYWDSDTIFGVLLCYCKREHTYVQSNLVCINEPPKFNRLLISKTQISGNCSKLRSMYFKDYFRFLMNLNNQ